MKRRRLLLALVPAIASAGCSNAYGGPSDRTSESATPPTETPTPPIYLSGIRPDPEGDDTEKLNEEFVFIETQADEQRDLSKYSLEYAEKHQYSFPDLMTEVEPGANIEIRSGSGESRVEGSNNPKYLLFVGSDEPLLENGGMQLTLRDDRGEVVDRVTYRAMAEGVTWAKSE